MKIILVNGPPRGGKDTVGKIFKEKNAYLFNIAKFSEPIKEALRQFFGLSNKEFHDFDEELKDIPQERLLGKSWRWWCIKFSEDFAKIHGGPLVFGQILSDNLKTQHTIHMACPDWDPENKGVVFITDSGFDTEAGVVIDNHPGNVYLIQIERDGCNYDNDSRKYLTQETKEKIGLDKCFWVTNNGTIAELEIQVQSILDKINN